MEGLEGMQRTQGKHLSDLEATVIGFAAKNKSGIMASGWGAEEGVLRVGSQWFGGAELRDILLPVVLVLNLTMIPIVCWVIRRGNASVDELSAELPAVGLNRFYTPVTGDLEVDCTVWLESLTGHVRGDLTFHAWLRNGQVLCKAANAIYPGLIPSIHETDEPFKQMENISMFLRACRSLGVPEHDVFTTVDLFEGKRIRTVQICVFRLAECAKGRAKYSGPLISTSKQTPPQTPDLTPR